MSNYSELLEVPCPVNGCSWSKSVDISTRQPASRVHHLIPPNRARMSAELKKEHYQFKHRGKPDEARNS